MRVGRIHKDNYEAFLLDRAEGTLSADLEKELDLFLAKNPELVTDLEGLDDVSLMADDTTFDQKMAIKRSEKDLVSDETFVAYIEKQLNPKDTLYVEKSIANNPLLQKELDLYKKTILLPDPEIVYEPKSKLKRRTKVIWFNPDYVRYAAAAAVLLAVGLFFLWNNKPVHDNPTAEVIKHQPVQPNMVPTNSLVASTASLNITSANNHDRNSLPSNTSSNIAKQEVQITNASVKDDKNKPEIPNNDPLIANHTVTVSNPDSANALVISPKKPKEENPVVQNNPAKTTLVTVIENDNEGASPTKNKNSLWALAGKALKRLNKAGVKTVDGNEKDNPKTTDYSLTFGGLRVTHSQNLE